MNRSIYLALLFFACNAAQCVAQGSGNQVAMNLGKLRQKNREDEVARIIDQMRTNAGLFRLKRLRSSSWDVRLTCTAAVDKRPLEDWVGMRVFEVHSPQELTANAAFSRLIRKEADKQLPRYSVTVFLDPAATQARPMFVVGIALQESWRDHLYGCLLTEDGCNFSYALKKVVSPECAKLR
jgi:hypothetical protein